MKAPSNAKEIPLLSVQLDSAMNAPLFKENICFHCGKEAADSLMTLSKKDQIKRLCTGCYIAYRSTFFKQGWTETTY